jgi:hypothetical protein
MRIAPAGTLVLLCLLASGCVGGSWAAPTSPRSTPSHGPGTGTIEGRAYTAACGGLLAKDCAPRSFRGSLVFCRTMNEIGPCPTARVDAAGRYRITLAPGRWAVIPAPGSRDVVVVEPRWVRVGMGQVRRLDLRGDNSMK